MSKLSLKFNQKNFNDFIQKLANLTQIEDVIKLKIDSDNILMYSMISNESAVLALKSFHIPTIDVFENFSSDKTYDFIITAATKFVKNLRFLDPKNPIKVDFTAKPLQDNEDVMHIRSAQFTNAKLKISCVGGEEFKIRDITKKALETRLNPKLSKWKFSLSREDFSNIKKLAAINSEDKILNINVNSGKVFFNELAKWELEVDEISQKNEQIVFQKKYLGNINELDTITFTIFETFILIKDDISNLMLSFEQDFTE
jgi:hypothetical protein